VSRAGERLEFRLGDPDVLLSFGEHVFTITYRTAGQLGFFEDHDELYWNATGNDWPFVIEKASFRAKLPGREFGEGFSAVEFYTGRTGEKGQDARALPDGTVESAVPFAPERDSPSSTPGPRESSPSLRRLRPFWNGGAVPPTGRSTSPCRSSSWR
jgi:hypothetical protein